MRTETEVRKKLEIIRSLLAEKNEASAILPIVIPFISIEGALEWMLGADNEVEAIEP